MGERNYTLSLDTLHEGYACSTLILGDFPFRHNWNNEPIGSFETFKEKLRDVVKDYGYVSYYDYKDKDKVRHHSFITASTTDKHVEIEKFLKKFGFKSTSQRHVKNAKNDTRVKFWSMSIPQFLKALKKDVKV